MLYLGYRFALIIVFALCACSRVVTSGVTTQNTHPGILRLAYPQEPPSLNPLPLEGVVGADVNNLIYSGLWTFDNKGNLYPDLATRIPTVQNGDVAHDGRTIVVHLRHGVVWQDGSPLTSRDIAFTVQTYQDARNIVPTRYYWESISTVATPDDYTAVFHVRHPFGFFYFAMSTAVTAILPKHLLARYSDLNRIAFNSHPVGSGPLEVSEWAHGDHITLVANMHYWRGPPKLRAIILKIIPDSNTILTQLRTGELDGWLRADKQAYPTLVALHGYRVLTAPWLGFATLDFNVRDPILQDVRVRRAIAAAIDRSRLIKSLTFGLAQPIDADQPRQSWAFNPHTPHIPYDPGAAKQLLDQAGWSSASDGKRYKAGQQLTLQLDASSTPSEAPRAATLIQSQLRAVGIEISIKVYPREVLNARAQNAGILYSGRYQMSVDAWVPNDDPDDYSGYGCAQFPPAGQNWNFWCNRRADAAMLDAQHTLDQARRKRDYAIVQETIATELPQLLLWQSERIEVLSDHLHGYIPSFDASGIWNAWQWAMQ